MPRCAAPLLLQENRRGNDATIPAGSETMIARGGPRSPMRHFAVGYIVNEGEIAAFVAGERAKRRRDFAPTS